MKNKREYNNLLAMKALEETDLNLAIKAISNPKLCPVELSEILEASMLGKYVFKETNEPIKLHDTVIAAGCLNRIRQLEYNDTIS